MTKPSIGSANRNSNTKTPITAKMILLIIYYPIMLALIQKSVLIKTISTLVIIFIVAILALAFLDDKTPGETVKQLGARAFGSLSNSTPGVADETLDTSLEPVPDGLGAGGTSEKEMYPIIEETFPYIDEVVSYEYIYEGELPDLSAVDQTVYKRSGTMKIPRSIAEALSNLNFGILPLTNFDGLSISSFALVQDDPSGFTINVDSINNSFSLWRNSGYMLDYDYSRVFKKEEIPNDDAIIKITNDFLNTHGFDLSIFGSPIIDRSWLQPDVWVPEALSAIYPFIIDGKEVWNMWGQPTGLSVNVNFREMEVDSLYAPGNTPFETSAYEITNDTEQILKVMKRGGFYGVAVEGADKIYTSKLGEPKVVLAEHYLYSDDGTQTTLFVPALQFPVIASDDERPYFQSSVVVPLVKEILEDTKTEDAQPVLLRDELDNVEKP